MSKMISRFALPVVAILALNTSAAGQYTATSSSDRAEKDIVETAVAAGSFQTLVAAVKASEGFLAGTPIAELMYWINLMVVYDVVFTAVAFMVFEYIVQE